jgi:hypothetical protein
LIDLAPELDNCLIKEELNWTEKLPRLPELS